MRAKQWDVLPAGEHGKPREVEVQAARSTSLDTFEGACALARRFRQLAETRQWLDGEKRACFVVIWINKEDRR